MAKDLKTRKPKSNHRNQNMHADELQVLLQACIDVGVEEVLRQGGRTEPLFYDVQQRMSHYGDFPERKLYRLRKYYLKTKRDFCSGMLNPYPPEARQLWGSTKHDADASDNDERWADYVRRTLQRKQSHSYVSKAESREIISQALQRNLENLPKNKQEYAFKEILSELTTKKMFLNRNVEMLKRAYLRLQKQFQKGSAHELLPEAAQLWLSKTSINTEMPHSKEKNGSLTQITQDIRQDEPKSVEKIDSVCRICQARLLETCKDLLQDTYNSQTYGEIIQETIQVQIPCDEHTSSKICLYCSKFVENMVLFIQQCREASIHTIPMKFDEFYLEEEDVTIEPNQTKLDIEYLDEPIGYGSDKSFSPVRSASPVAELRKPESVNEENVEETITDEQKYNEYVKSLPARNRKRQCHVCGKSVRDLAQHMTTHGTAELQCEFCPRKFLNKRQLKIHMNMHTKKTVYSCRICERIYYNWTTRKNHELTHKVKFNCDECDAVYAYASQLRQHIKHKHKGIRRLSCSYCSFTTFIKTRLLNHVRSIHTSERPYRCTFCESTSNSSTGYYIHFQRHKKSGEATEYSILCAYCGQQFSKDAALEVHICEEHQDVAVII
ncbi:zinc finger protein 62 homolog [Wyeomyia smithii]|uniref:zinc finger protein 62 homolog n=1 Tax=Wyeomyia smithii TaxID=174621 RepID=UPI002467D07B|nr:zinc finger protein 62 homolog [Wyeomyia smithii]